MVASVVVAHRQPTLRIPWPAHVEPDVRISVYWDGQRAANGDGKPGTAGIDYTAPLDSRVRAVDTEHASMFGGGWCNHPWGQAGAVSSASFGWGNGPWCIGAWCSPWGWWQWAFPFQLRDGDYRLALLLSDAKSNEQSMPDEVFGFRVAAAPRAAARANVQYDVDADQLILTWRRSPEWQA